MARSQIYHEGDGKLLKNFEQGNDKSPDSIKGWVGWWVGGWMDRWIDGWINK